MTGGPSTNLKSTIAQTMPFEIAGSNNSVISPSTGVMNLTAILIPGGQTIANINFISSASVSVGGTHLWFALYDDGRGSSSAGQLALLGQTNDNGGNMGGNVGLSLLTPYTTTYSGIYFLGFMCTAATQMPQLAGSARNGTATIQVSPYVTFSSGTAGSGLTNQAPNPSGAVTSNASNIYAYIS